MIAGLTLQFVQPDCAALTPGPKTRIKGPQQSRHPKDFLPSWAFMTNRFEPTDLVVPFEQLHVNGTLKSSAARMPASAK